MKSKVYLLSIIVLLALGVSLFNFTDIKSVFKTKEEQSGIIYFVRHAEKVKDVENPPLTIHGAQRAEELANYLLTLNIESIYATRFLRAQNMAMPLAVKLGFTVETYEKEDTDSLMSVLLEKGGIALVVGHWDTANDSFKYFDEEVKYDTEKANDSSNILRVTYSKNKPTEVVLLKY